MSVTNYQAKLWLALQQRIAQKKAQQERTAAAVAVMKKPQQQARVS